RHVDGENRQTGEVVPALDVAAGERIAAGARSNEGDLPRAVRDRDLALVLEESETVRAAVERTGDDVHRASALRRGIAKRVLELRPDALIQVRLLRDDVREIEGGGVVAVRRGAI